MRPANARRCPVRTIKWCLRLIGSSLRVTLVAALSVAMVAGGLAMANNYNATVPGSGTSFASVVISSVNYASMLLCDFTVGETACATVKAASTAAVQTDTALVERNPDVGTTSDSTCSTDTGTCTVTALVKRTNQDLTTLNTSVNAPLAAGTNNIGGVTPMVGTTGGATVSSAIAPATPTGSSLKAAAGTLYGVQCTTIQSTPVYIKFYNSASAPTPGSGTPVARFMCPAANTAANGAGSNLTIPSVGIAFGTGIGYVVTGALADNDTTSITATNTLVNIEWN